MDLILKNKSPLHKANFYLGIGNIYSALTELCYAFQQSGQDSSVLQLLERVESYLPCKIPVNYINIFSIRTAILNKKENIENKKQTEENVLESKFVNYSFYNFLSVRSNHEDRESENATTAQSYINILENTILKDGNPVLILSDDLEETKWHSAVIPIPVGSDAYYLGFSKNSSTIYPVGLGIAKVEATHYLHAKIYFNVEYARAVIARMKKICLIEENDNYSAAIYDILKDWNIYGSHRPLYQKKMPFCKYQCFEEYTGHISIYSSFNKKYSDQRPNIPLLTYKTPSIQQKYAVVSIGHYRTFDQTVDNFKKETEIVCPDYYFNTWSTQNAITWAWHNPNSDKKDLTQGQIALLRKFDPNVVIEKQLDPDEYPPELDKSQVRNAKFLYSVWYSFHALQSALKRIKDSGIYYDFVFVTRFDILLQDLDLKYALPTENEIIMGRTFSRDYYPFNDIIFCFKATMIDKFIDEDFIERINRRKDDPLPDSKYVERFLLSFFRENFKSLNYRWLLETHFRLIR